MPTPPPRKLYPRNSTARSHPVVAGNPVTTRPESGVDNSFPGLEFDQRNLDKRFFPGLEFELHAQAVLRTIDPARAAPIHAALAGDLPAGIVLVAVAGTFGEAAEEVAQIGPSGGLQDWRVVHDLSPGRVALALAPFGSVEPRERIVEAFVAYLAGGNPAIEVTRQGDGRLRFAFVTGERARILDDNGVIDPDEYHPGDLTRSLCSPWQYDFALCGCFYWASNKPDLVSPDADTPQIANFQRDRVNPQPIVPVTDYGTWQSLDIGEVEMIERWETLPAVFDGIEGRAMAVATAPRLPDEDVLDRATIVRALRELATVEHGLMVEYLYAYYSLDQNAFADNMESRQRVVSAAQTVLSVAIDEMRHLRWVNEMLLAVGERHELGRFETLPDIDRDGRGLTHTFSLTPLVPERLDWFITVEAPSEAFDPDAGDDTIDGMYTRLLLSIEQGDAFSGEVKERLLQLIKLIIEEGQDHYQRFLRVRERLQGLDPNLYIRLTENPAPLPAAAPASVFERIANVAYAQVIELLALVFTPRNIVEADALITGARELMYNLDEAARTAAANGGAPLFILPAEPAVSGGVSMRGPVTEAAAPVPVSPAEFIKRGVAPALEAATAGLDPAADALVRSMRSRVATLEERFAGFGDGGR
ncbi:ferritin-like domain-containing protein [Acuticoccus sediminis]|uniref:ferritin-like domain-containing protein n=1 Tax=Acuticoccus sediminis TaxID=2184697 RepID=UPI001CFC9F2C|nr:ferritin-like domain-containing protein [Acuticoccus sediminis]